MRWIAVLISAVAFASPALAEECVYGAPDGRFISFPEPDYMTIQIGEHTRWCQSAEAGIELVVECPTDEGTVTESVVTFVDAGLVWEGELWLRQCFQPT